MFDDDRGKKREVSEFNSAVAYLNRINLILARCDESAINLEVYSWYHSLLCLLRELSTEIKQTEMDKFNTDISALKEQVNDYIQRNRESNINEVDAELYDNLHNFEMSLRFIMKESGLQQKMRDEAEKALN